LKTVYKPDHATVLKAGNQALAFVSDMPIIKNSPSEYFVGRPVGGGENGKGLAYQQRIAISPHLVMTHATFDA